MRNLQFIVGAVLPTSLLILYAYRGVNGFITILSVASLVSIIFSRECSKFIYFNQKEANRERLSPIFLGLGIVGVISTTVFI